MHLAAINVHPLKSGAIRPLTQARLERTGLVDDRRWMTVDPDGFRISARTDPLLFTITARTPDLDGIDGALELSTPGQEPIMIDRPDSAPATFHLPSSDVTGILASPRAHAWVSEVLHRPARLVWCPDPHARTLDPGFSQPDDATAYADGYPALLTTSASLDQLNAWIVETAAERGEDAPDPLPMQRFRPNLVVAGSAPFAEDAWRRLRIGDVVLRVAKPSDRCVMTTVDPLTLARGKEPLRTLARHRKVGSKVLFGTNVIPDGTATLRVGDPVTVLDRA